MSVFILLGHKCTAQQADEAYLSSSLSWLDNLISKYLDIYLVLEVRVKISPVRDDHIRALQHYKVFGSPSLPPNNYLVLP